MGSMRVSGRGKGAYGVLEREISIENRFSPKRNSVFKSTYCGIFMKFNMFYNKYVEFQLNKMKTKII